MRRVLLTPRWLLLHALALVMIVTCIRLSWWQFLRAESGNGRSLGYALQWPGFAIFVVGMWYWLARDAVRGGPAARAEPTVRGRVPDELVLPPLRDFSASGGVPGAVPGRSEEDDELAAFNRMLAALHEQDQRSGRAEDNLTDDSRPTTA